ncbi:MAG TPA: PilZ domain-containing protein [Burkholderiales bacterium]|nr:PilZ domain-containing protein [Burkholderiales bacterium]
MNRKLLSRQDVAASEQSFWIDRALTAQSTEGARHSLRRRPDLDVLVNYGLAYSRPWQVRDLSMNGAFVEIEGGPLPEMTYVEVVLRYHYKGRDVELRLPATVRRVVGQGMALRFGYYDDQAYTDLANLLYAQ